MKKVKYLIFIAICFIGFNITNVYAGNATGGVTSNGEEDCSIKYDGEDANGNTVSGVCHHNYGIEINYNGQKFEGYCGDLNKHLSGGQSSYTCEEVADASLAYILGSNYSRSEKTAALRGYTTGLKNNNANASQLLADAQNGAGLSLVKVAENGNVVTYQVSTGLNASDIKFTCGAGCSNISYSGSTLTVTVTQGACSYSFTASYPGIVSTPGGRVLRCHSRELQDVYILDISDTTSSSGTTTTGDRTTQSFSGSLENTGSDYYKKYCDGEEKPNKCNEKTEIVIPTYCDDPNDEKITITAPKDVQYCILNGRDDAGNTYKMDDNQISKDNPYCAVYCKEDYEMTMPGAQYTNSGSYFSLKNTVVKATRTCYATNPKGNSDEPQILIDEFITQIIAKQKELLAARNAYLKAKLEKELSDSPKETEMRGCHKSVGTKYEITSESFTGVNENPQCDQRTGICQVVGQTHSTDDYAWGVVSVSVSESKGYTDNSGLYHEGSCSASPSTAEKPDFAGKLAEAESNLIRIQNELKQMTDWMHECYNWVNNLCMDTQVQFDYNEQYSTDINYQLVSGGGTFTGNDATYGTSKNIDRNYNANSGSSLENPGYVYCDTTTCNHTNIAEQISTLQNHLYYRKIEVSGTAEYANIQQFQTNYPHGTIDTVADQSALRYNYSYLGAVFPIALNTPTGVYKWTLNFSGLGQYNDSVGCRNGRLDDVIRAQGKSVGAGLEYVCVYVVDCDDCDYECVGEGCLIPDEPKCPECDVYCTNCIFNGDGLTVNYRMIGDDPNPNERAMGSNWTNEKGQKVLEEILKLGQEIYIEAQYTYVMDANNMKATRDYNKETGTYVAEDLVFHDAGGIRNAYGTSSFLDNGEKNGFFKEIKRNKNWQQWENVGNNMGTALS